MADIPKIRFKGFTEPWEQRKLSDVTESIKNGYTYRADGSRDHRYKITRIESISSGVINTEKLGSSDEVNENYRLVDGDILFSHINSLPYIANTALYTADLGEIYHGMNLLNIRSRHEEIDSHFLLHLLKKESTRDWFRIIAKPAVNQASISTTEVGSFKFLIPGMEEQKKISSSLDNLDHLITLHQRKCDDTKKLKKYMLQKMFPKNGEKFPEIRFKGFTEAWEQRKFQDVVEVAYQGINTTADKVEYVNKGVPILQGKHITSGKIDYKDVRYLDKEKYEPIYYPKYVPKANDILLANIGTIGPSVVMEHGVELLIAWNIMLIRLNEKADVKFVKVFLDKLNNSNFYESIMRGNATKFINKEGIMNIEIPYPSVCEQQKIGAYFANLDHLITLHRRAL